MNKTNRALGMAAARQAIYRVRAHAEVEHFTYGLHLWSVLGPRAMSNVERKSVHHLLCCISDLAVAAYLTPVREGDVRDSIVLPDILVDIWLLKGFNAVKLRVPHLSGTFNGVV